MSDLKLAQAQEPAQEPIQGIEEVEKIYADSHININNYDNDLLVVCNADREELCNKIIKIINNIDKYIIYKYLWFCVEFHKKKCLKVISDATGIVQEFNYSYEVVHYFFVHGRHDIFNYLTKTIKKDFPNEFALLLADIKLLFTHNNFSFRYYLKLISENELNYIISNEVLSEGAIEYITSEKLKYDLRVMLKLLIENSEKNRIQPSNELIKIYNSDPEIMKLLNSKKDLKKKYEEFLLDEQNAVKKNAGGNCVIL